MALVNLNNNNNVLQREKDKENDFSNKTRTFVSGKKDAKFEQKSEKQQQFVENQNQKNKKDKARRKQNVNNNISVFRSDFVTSDGGGKERTSTGTMTISTKNNKYANTSPHHHFQYDRNHLFSLGMQMQVANQRSRTPPTYRNNSNVNPSTTDYNPRVNGTYETPNYQRYLPMSGYTHWNNGNDHENHRRFSSSQQPNSDNNNWHHSQYNWNNYPNTYYSSNSPNNRPQRPWRSNTYLNQGYRNKTFENRAVVQIETNPETNNKTRNASPSPQLPLVRKSSSKSSLTDKSSQSSVNSSPDIHSSEVEFDSDASSSKVTKNKSSKKGKGNNKRQGKTIHPVESRSAPEISTLNDFRPSTDQSRIPPSGFYQQQHQQGFYGSQQCLTINNWVSNFPPSNNNNIGNGQVMQFPMYVQDIPYEMLSSNGEFYMEDGNNQKKQRSLSKDRSPCSLPNNVPVQPEVNNNYMLYPTPFPPQQIQQNMPASRSKHVMNHVHRFNAPKTNPYVQTKPNVPPDSFLYNFTLPFVKDIPKDLLNGSKWDPISKDIWNKFTVSQQSEVMYNKKIQLWRYLYTSIKSQFPQYGLYMVGSTIAGFGTDSSDVDMCLVCRENPVGVDLRTNAMVTLYNIQKFLQNFIAFDEFHLIQARVPILRFKDVENEIEVDLNYNNSVGIRNTHLLHCYAQMDWRLRPLVLIVKLWAQFHNINDARNATLPSYSLVLMVIHFLQCGVTPPVLPCLHKAYPDKFSVNRDFIQIDMNEVLDPIKSENQETLGELFVKFLGYYSKFDYSCNAISVRTASCLPIEHCRNARSPKNDTHQWKVLCIEEPFDLTNTARSVYDYEVFERVKATFSTSWQLLSESNRLDSVFSAPLFTPVYQQYSPSPNLTIIYPQSPSKPAAKVNY